MKKARKILCVILALTLCFAFPLSASAGTSSKAAGVYGTLKGTSTQASPFLSVTATVTNNPDSAKLRVSAQFYYSYGTTNQEFHSSSSGATSYTYKYPIYIEIDGGAPTSAYCSHEVYGTTSTSYVTYTAATISV